MGGMERAAGEPGVLAAGGQPGGLSLVYVEMQLSSRPLDPVLAEQRGISSDLEREGKKAFWRIMRDPSVVSWFSIPFAALLIGPGFTGRGISA